MSVESKVTALLFVPVVVLPFVAFVLLQTRGVDATTNYLVFLVVASIILIVPFAKWMSDSVALRSIRELNRQCRLLKAGDYSQVELPPSGRNVKDFSLLKRNMHWMGYTIANRERRLKQAMTELSTVQRQIGQSLEYAGLIQTSFLPCRRDLARYIPGHFLIWEQREEVGGDAYWLRPTDTGFFVGVLDCTGHGVPGAFMTLIVYSLLEKAATRETDSPAEILGRMNRFIKDALGQQDRTSRSDDGMDCALCHVARGGTRVTFAGAHMPLYVVGQGEVRCIRGERMGVGYVRSPRDHVFTDVDVAVDRDTRLYMSTDGLTDQVGSDNHLPFGRNRLMEFLTRTRALPIMVQGEELLGEHRKFQGREVRRDDVTVLGFELKGVDFHGNEIV